MDIKDFFAIVLSAIAALISLYTVSVVKKNAVYEPMERGLFAVNDKFIEFPHLRPYFYDGAQIDD